jgi:hypothetical protein
MENITDSEKLMLLKLRLDFFSAQINKAKSQILDMAFEGEEFNLGNLEGTYLFLLENVMIEKDEYNDFINR